MINTKTAIGRTMTIQDAHNKVKETVRLSMDEKREQARRLILDVSLELFYTNGYQATTTRDIVKKAGILNGSLYNRFKSKEDILVCIVTEYLEGILKESEYLIEKENNLVIAAILPSAFEVYVSSVDPKAADLFYEAHKVWAAVERYTEINLDWLGRYLGRFGIDLSSIDNAELKMKTYLGAIGNICGYYVNDGNESCEKILKYMLDYMAATINTPIFGAEKIIEKILLITKNTAKEMYGNIPHVEKEE